jgi:peptide-methionine (S)-S-oxide reductase
MSTRAWLAALAALALAAPVSAQQQLETATFAGGCFWCMEAAFDKVPGVVSTTSGYTGGRTQNPTYEEVSSGRTGHVEAEQVVFDPKKVSYSQLLDVFWLNHDPTVTDRQFCDVGSEYQAAIFYHDAEQKRLAEASKAKYEKLKPFSAPLLTPIRPAGKFWPAEAYHQNYHLKNPIRYKLYATGCGRYARLDELWGKLRKKNLANLGSE